MMRPDDGTVDHVGTSVSFDQIGEGFEHGVKHPGLHPSSVATEDAVPLPYSSGRCRHCAPVRAIHIIAPIVMCRAASAPAFSRQQRPDQRPFLVRQPDPFAQDCL
jgi:hypothetical protein